MCENNGNIAFAQLSDLPSGERRLFAEPFVHVHQQWAYDELCCFHFGFSFRLLGLLWFAAAALVLAKQGG